MKEACLYVRVWSCIYLSMLFINGYGQGACWNKVDQIQRYSTQTNKACMDAGDAGKESTLEAHWKQWMFTVHSMSYCLHIMINALFDLNTSLL